MFVFWVIWIMIKEHDSLHNDTSSEITIAHIIMLIKQSFAIVILGAVLGLIGGLCFTKVMFEEKYSSTIKLYAQIPQGETVTSSAQLKTEYELVRTVVNTYFEMLSTKDFYEKIKVITNSKESANKIGKMIKFSARNGTEIFKATVTADDPYTAVAIAAAIGEEAPRTLAALQGYAIVKIVDNPSMNPNSIKPNYRRNLILGFVAGLVLAVGVIVLKDMLDVRIKSSEDLYSRYNVNILAEVSDMNRAERKLKKH